MYMPEGKKLGVPITSVLKNKGISILIVEDDKFLRELISKKLSGKGFNVLEATNGETGLHMMKKERPQLVLLDLILPGMDGFDLLRDAAKDKEVSSIPMVVLSNINQKGDIDRALSLGAREFLVKARYTPGEVVDKVESILNDSYVNM